MEAHPIPQNVTAFEFRLVGDMTLKQFLYLSAGLGTSYLIFVFLLPTLGFAAGPLIVIFAVLGVAFAFMPIADRPLDYWLKAFLKAVYSPTQLSWSKNKHSWQEEALFSKRGIIISQVIASLEASTLPVITKITLPSSTTTSTPARPTPATRGEQASFIPSATPMVAPVPVSVPPVAPVSQSVTKAEPVKVVPVSKVRTSQLVLTTSPNVINGVVTDSVGNYLEGVVVIIYDKTGLPVRALKTNKLGQFSGATPLPNGTYLIELEKESLVFDKMQINLKGAVLPSITIAAKKLI